MEQVYGKVNSIETLGLVDGPGVRVVVFMQGCPLRCKYCHNPEMWEYKNDFAKDYSVSELVNYILKYKNYIYPNGGVTFSGGEPLVWQEFILECAKLLKKEGIHVCLDTSGSVLLNNDLLNYIDLVILDVKSIDDDKYLDLTSKNINNFNNFLNLCQKQKTRLWLRQVIVPNYNDSENDIRLLADYIKRIKYVEKVELLPYHTTGVVKYRELGYDYPLENVKAMDKKNIEELEKLLLNLLKI